MSNDDLIENHKKSVWPTEIRKLTLASFEPASSYKQNKTKQSRTTKYKLY